jgi:hypothetical protein
LVHGKIIQINARFFHLGRLLKYIRYYHHGQIITVEYLPEKYLRDEKLSRVKAMGKMF